MSNKLPTFTHAYLSDKVIEELQTKLKENLPWLQVAYGRCERLVKTIDGKRYYTPNVYKGNNEYESLLPDDRRGCYSFFVMAEPQEVKQMVQVEIRVKCPFSLIVWVDMRWVERVMNLPDERNTEYVKEQVLSVLDSAFTRKGRISINKIYERAENVFSGFTLDEVQNQFLMSPFAGFRFTGEMLVTNDCTQ
jgi:hypothetical protein